MAKLRDLRLDHVAKFALVVAEQDDGERCARGADRGQIVDPAEVFDDHTFDPKVVTPHLLDELRIVATLDVDAAGQRDPRACAGHRDRTRGRARRSLGGGLQRRRGQDDGLAVDQETRAQREALEPAVAILEVDPAELDAYHRADPAALRVLDHQAEFRGVLGRPSSPVAVRVSGQNVGAVAIIHPGILWT